MARIVENNQTKKFRFSGDFIFRCVMMAGICILAIGLISIQAWADEQLAKQSQNPIGNLISVPFQNNGYFGIGPSDSSAYVLNIQPVYPVTFGNVNLINRMTLPVIGLQGQDRRLRTENWIWERLVPFQMLQRANLA